MRSRLTISPFAMRMLCLAWVAALPWIPGTNAQGLYVDGAIFIDGVSIHVDGEVRNTGKIDNDGVFSLTGNWDSEGRYKGKGTVVLAGNSPQKIAHYGQTIRTLVADGWGTKYVKGHLYIAGGLVLNNGIVGVSPDAMLKLQEGATARGGSDESYVDGALTVEGTGYKYFPIGKNGTYAPMEFLDVQGMTAEYSVEAFENASAVSVDDIIVRNSLYWQRNDIAGTFGGSKVAIDYDTDYFRETEGIAMVAGTTWDEPFFALRDLDHSSETAKISTRTVLTAPIIMLGEVSRQWTDADFYLSTALSPHAEKTSNRSIKIFGQRLTGDQFRLQVFNRLGEQVYETSSLEEMATNGWDGRTSSGFELPSGVYPYRLTAVDKAGKAFDRKGVITIIH
jgi:hypothetical protein